MRWETRWRSARLTVRNTHTLLPSVCLRFSANVILVVCTAGIGCRHAERGRVVCCYGTGLLCVSYLTSSLCTPQCETRSSDYKTDAVTLDAFPVVDNPPAPTVWGWTCVSI